MKQIPLGRSGIMVSDWCLGTMTFGNQTLQDDAEAQMNRALDAGITFFDTAEMYPVNPVKAETVGNSERVIGEWVKNHARRNEAVIATKVSGANGGFVRGGKGFDRAVINEAVDASLKRLNTDVIDLYQFHWPDRGSYMFRQNWNYDPSKQDRQQTMDHMMDALEGINDVVKAGKVRAFGLSNESCWGMTKWVDLAEAAGLPRAASVQNEYSLLCRLYDTDMAEMAVNEDILLLSFSPLACGLLTGKYQGGQVPELSRMSLSPDLGGRMSPRVLAAVQVYLDIAAKHGIDPVHMSMAWQRSRPFPISAIFGTTSVAQLDHLIAGEGLVLSDEILAELNAANRQNPLPY